MTDHADYASPFRQLYGWFRRAIDPPPEGEPLPPSYVNQVIGMAFVASLLMGNGTPALYALLALLGLGIGLLVAWVAASMLWTWAKRAGFTPPLFVIALLLLLILWRLY